MQNLTSVDFTTHHSDEQIVESETGAKRGAREGKGRYDLISPFALMRLAQVYERGAEQKGERNWEKGFEWSRCLDSAQRHITQFRAGMIDEDHLAQAVWNLFAYMHFQATGAGVDDTQKYPETLTNVTVKSISRVC